MKVIILAGGYAKRMWPLTENQPKALLPVANRPIVDYIFDKLAAVKSDKIYVSTNQKFEDHFKRWMRAFFEKNSEMRGKVELVVEPTVSEEQKLGAVGALWFLLEKIGVDDDVLVVAGDNLFEFDFKKFLAFNRRKRATSVAFYDMKDKELVKGKYGLGVLDRSRKVVGFQEKTQEPKSTLVSTGIYLFPKNILPLIKTYLDDRNNPDAPGYFITWLHQREPVYGFVFKEKWFDIGSFEMYREADEEYKKRLAIRT